MDKRIKLLCVGDGGCPTGFARVLHSIQKYLPKDTYDIYHLAVNYFGDPHPFPCKMYPAALPGGDMMGISRLGNMIHFIKPDLIFILNDPWNIHEYLKVLRDIKDMKIPPIIVYYPVDATDLNEDWFQYFNLVSRTIVYTQFGYDETKKAAPDLSVQIIPHGIESSVFFKTDRLEAKKQLFVKERKDLHESWIVLNAGRNQPRKRLDLSIEAFALFSKGKPDNVKYYSHSGLKDAGWDIIKLCRRFGISNRLIITSKSNDIQAVSDEWLNTIYNACEVGLNTGLGEGWGLPNVEHAITGAPQVVPDASACKEIFFDCGLLVPISQHLIYPQTSTTGSLVKPEDVAEKLELLYNNKELYDKLAEVGIKKFTAPEYSWEAVAKQFDTVFKEVV